MRVKPWHNYTVIIHISNSSLMSMCWFYCGSEHWPQKQGPAFLLIHPLEPSFKIPVSQHNTFVSRARLYVILFFFCLKNNNLNTYVIVNSNHIQGPHCQAHPSQMRNQAFSLSISKFSYTSLNEEQKQLTNRICICMKVINVLWYFRFDLITAWTILTKK